MSEGPRNVGRIKFSDKIWLQHKATGMYLAALSELYRDEGNPDQFMVVAVSDPGVSAVWFVHGRHSASLDASLHLGVVLSGAKIRLWNDSTQRYLHSHGDRHAPLTRGQQEVTAYGKKDENDDWVILVQGSDELFNGASIKLQHTQTGKFLRSNEGRAHSIFTMGGQEVACSDDDSTGDIWIAAIVGSFTPSRSAAEAVDRRAASDQPTADDRLGFSPYVEAVAEFLTSDGTKPPLTLSVEGSWGSGKSSFMLQLKERLEKHPYLVVEFNAWRHDKDESLWSAFALELQRKLAEQMGFVQRFRALLRLTGSRFDWWAARWDVCRFLFRALLFVVLGVAVPAMLIFFPGWLASLVGRYALAAKALLVVCAVWVYYKNTPQLARLVRNPFSVDLLRHIRSPDYRQQLAFIEAFHEDLRRVLAAHSGFRFRNRATAEKIFVFIDDLDRCEVPKAADMLQAINLMIPDAWSSPLIFVIGMDRERVAAALAVKYEKLVCYLPPTSSGLSKVSGDPPRSDPEDLRRDRALGFGFDFIEKFIQLSFRVPTARQQVEDLVATVMPRDDVLEADTVGSGRAPVLNAAGSEAGEGSLGDQPVVRGVAREGSESPIIRQIVGFLSPHLGSNPRRIKQFLNLFRLNALIGEKTGMLRRPFDDANSGRFTLWQLGKFIVLTMRWPSIVGDLDADFALLHQLQVRALGATDTKRFRVLEIGVDGDGAPFERWARRADLIEFLGAGCHHGADDYKMWTLADVRPAVLLAVSPRVVRRVSGSGEGAAMAPG